MYICLFGLKINILSECSHKKTTAGEFPFFVYGGVVGAEKQPVYGGGRYLMNIYFLKYCCLVKPSPNRHGH